MSTPPLIIKGGEIKPSQIIQTRDPEVTYNSKGIEPPSPLHLTLNDQLFVKIFAPTIALPFSVNIELRLLTPEGEIKPTRQTILVNASAVTLPFSVDECFILSASASLAGGATANRGQIFCQLLVIRNTPADPLVLWTLLSDYITTNSRPSWPNGEIRSPLEGNGNLRTINGTTPALGAEVNQTVPNGVRWTLRGLFIGITTSANVANREVTLRLFGGGNAFFNGPSGFSQAASLTRFYAFARGINNINGAVALLTALAFPDVPLLAGWVFNTLTTNLQANDQYGTPTFEVEEWCDI